MTTILKGVQWQQRLLATTIVAGALMACKTAQPRSSTAGVGPSCERGAAGCVDAKAPKTRGEIVGEIVERGYGAAVSYGPFKPVFVDGKAFVARVQIIYNPRDDRKIIDFEVQKNPALSVAGLDPSQTRTFHYGIDLMNDRYADEDQTVDAQDGSVQRYFSLPDASDVSYSPRNFQNLAASLDELLAVVSTVKKDGSDVSREHYAQPIHDLLIYLSDRLEAFKPAAEASSAQSGAADSPDTDTRDADSSTHAPADGRAADIGHGR